MRKTSITIEIEIEQVCIYYEKPAPLTEEIIESIIEADKIDRSDINYFSGTWSAHNESSGEQRDLAILAIKQEVGMLLGGYSSEDLEKWKVSLSNSSGREAVDDCYYGSFVIYL